MKNVYSSPSAIVFLILAIALCVFTYFGKVDAKDFIILATMSFMHYFKKSGDNSRINSGQSDNIG